MALRLVLGVAELDRLIGGDTEVELELRRGVVENFARQKLSTLADHPEIKKALDDLGAFARSQVEERLGERVRDPKWPHGMLWNLRPEVKQMLDSAVEAAVVEMVARETEDIENRIKQAVERRVAEIQRQALREVERAVGDRWKREVTEEVQRIINTAAQSVEEAT